MGAFPICPEMSRFVPLCPRLSRFVPVLGPKKNQTNWETPPFSIHPHSALLEVLEAEAFI